MRTIKPMEITHFYVLLALAEGPLHGYAIHEQVERDSQSAIYFSYPALYNLLRNLEQRGWIEAVKSAYTKGPARQTYALTIGGKRQLKAAGTQLWDAGRLVRSRVA